MENHEWIFDTGDMLHFCLIIITMRVIYLLQFYIFQSINVPKEILMFVLFDFALKASLQVFVFSEEFLLYSTPEHLLGTAWYFLTDQICHQN